MLKVSPLPLVKCTGGNLEIVHKTITELQKNFSSGLDLVIIMAAGLLGTGKSTWLNTLLITLSKPECPSGYFHVGHTIETGTEGIWVYPFPLKLLNQQFQVMLLDMEGLEGIKISGNKDETQKEIMKLYTLGMMISSVVTIHTHSRIDNISIQSLQQAFSIIQRLNNNQYMEFPNIFLMVKDTNELKLRDSGTAGVISFLAKGCSLDRNLLPFLSALPKPPPPPELLTALQNHEVVDYAMLMGKDLADFNISFLMACVGATKKTSGFKKSMKINDLLELAFGVSHLINSDQFEHCFKICFEETIQDITLRTKNEIVEALKEASIIFAANFDTTLPLQKFIEAWQDMKITIIQEKRLSNLLPEKMADKLLPKLLEDIDKEVNIIVYESLVTHRKNHFQSLRDKVSKLTVKIDSLNEHEKLLTTELQNLENRLRQGQADEIKKNQERKANMNKIREEHRANMENIRQQMENLQERALQDREKVIAAIKKKYGSDVTIETREG